MGIEKNTFYNVFVITALSATKSVVTINFAVYTRKFRIKKCGQVVL